MDDNWNWSIFCGLASCALGGVFYIYYQDANKYLQYLKKISQIEVSEELVEKVKISDGKLPYVAVRGAVSADDKVIQSSHNTGVEGVIKNMKITEHKSKWSSSLKRWVETKRAISSNWQVESFSLVGTNADIKLNVLNPRDANELALETIVDKYDPINGSWGERILDFMVSERVTGIQTIEKMLLVGSKITVIGEVSVDNDRFSINIPSLGFLKYIITNESLEKIIKNEENVVYFHKVFVALCLTIGGVFFSYSVYKRIQEYLHRKYYQKCQQEMEEFNENCEVDDNTCSICLVEPRNVVCLPCGHVCSCKSCIEKVERCPVCRVPIERRAPIFYS